MNGKNLVHLVVALVLGLASTAFAGNNCYWQGGSGSLTDANWKDGGGAAVVPSAGNGDVLYFDTSDGNAISISVPSTDFAIAKIVFQSAKSTDGNGTVTFTGNRLRFAPSAGVVVSHPNIASPNLYGAKVVFDCPVSFGGGTVDLANLFTFNDTVTIDDNASLEFYCRDSASRDVLSKTGALVFNEEVVGPNAVLSTRCGFNAVGGSVRFCKKVTVKTYCSSHNSNSYETPTFRAAENDIGTLRWRYSYVTFTNSVPFAGSTPVIDNCYDLYGGNSGFEFKNAGSATIDRFSITTGSNTQPTGLKHYTRNYKGPSSGTMTITQQATASTIVDNTFSQGLAFVWDPQGDYTFTHVGNTNGHPSALTSPFTGSLDVKGGTWAVSNQVVYSGVSGITVREGATLDFSQCCTAVPVTSEPEWTIVEVGGRIVVPAGVTLRTQKLRYGSTAYQTAQELTSELPFIEGAGKIEVMGRTSPVECVWTGAGGDGKWSTSANWENGVMPISVAGDTVVFDTTDAALTVENDIEGLTLGSVKVANNHGNKFTLNGKKIVFSHANAFPLQLGSSSDIYTPLEFRDSGKIYLYSTDPSVNGGLGSCTLNFYGDVTLVGAITISFKNILDSTQLRGSPVIYFRGRLDGPSASVKMETGAGGYGGTLYVYGGTDLHFLGLDTELRNAHNSVHVSEGNNRIQQLWVQYSNGSGIYLSHPLVNADAELTLHNNQYGGGYLTMQSGEDYVFSNLFVSAHANTPNHCSYITSSDGGTLVARNAASVAKGLGQVCGNANFTWDPIGDYGITFQKTVHTTTGTFTVKRGTMTFTDVSGATGLTKFVVAAGARLVIDTTLADAFAAVQRIELGENAILELTDASLNPFGSSTVVEMGTGAKIVTPEGKTAQIHAVLNGGAPLAVDTYSGESWTQGGSVQVLDALSTSTTYWKSPVSGLWSDASKWSAGVPDGTHAANIRAFGADYTVTIDATPSAMPSTLDIDVNGTGSATLSVAATVALTEVNKVTVARNAKIEVPEGGEWTYTGSDAASCKTVMSITDGGELRINGGVVNFARFCGDVVVEGDGAVTSKVTVAAGSLELHGHQIGNKRSGTLFLNQSSLLDVQSVVNYYECLYGNLIVHQQGGEMRFTGEGKFRFHNGEAYTCYFAHGAGETRYTDNARFALVGNGNSRPSIKGDDTYGDAHVYLEDHAAIACETGGRLDYFSVHSSGMDSFGALHYDTTETLSTPRLFLGFESGEGRIYQSSGTIRISGSELGIGHEPNHTMNYSQRGRYYLNGGLAQVQADAYVHATFGYGVPWYTGLIIGSHPWGEGKTRATSFGELVISNGRMESANGVTFLGIGASTGRIVMNGGEFTSTATADYRAITPISLGVGGGYGELILSNGTFAADNPFYVGGVTTNLTRVPGGTKPLSTAFPSDRHDAEGYFQLAGGTFALDNVFTAGYDGTATVEVLGSQGTFSANSIVISNLVDTTFRFVADANGITTLRSAGPVSIAPGAKLEIDVSAYTGSRSLRFLTGSNLVGRFDDANVTLNGVSSQFEFVQNNTGIRLVNKDGTLLIFR